MRTGVAAATMRRSHGNTLSSHQRAMSGNESSRRVSPVGAQSTTITSNSPEAWWRLIWSRLKSSSMPGGTVSSSAAMSITPRSESSCPEPALDRAPVVLHLALGLDLLAPEPVCERRRVGAELGLERVGEAVCRVRREHHGAQAGGGAAARGRGGDAGLADAALAGVEDRSGGHRGGAGYRAASEPNTPIGRHGTRSLRAELLEIEDWRCLDPYPFSVRGRRAGARRTGWPSPAAAATTEGERADPQEVIDATFNNDEQVSSGVIDMSVDASAGDQGSFTASPRAARSRATRTTPRRCRSSTGTASVSGEGAGQSVDFEGGIVVTEDNAFVEYGGETYEVGADDVRPVQGGRSRRRRPRPRTARRATDAAASFQEGCAQAIEAQGGDPAACDFDIGAGSRTSTNEGTEDVEGTEAVHISGNVDVATDARRHLRSRHVGPERPGPGGRRPRSTRPPRRSPRPASTSTAARMTTSFASWT